MKIAKMSQYLNLMTGKTFRIIAHYPFLHLFSKIFEKVTSTGITTYLIENYVSHDSQFGFRSGLSTCIALLQIVDNISSSLDNNNVTVGVFIDLAKAFFLTDSCWVFFVQRFYIILRFHDL